MGVDRHSRDDCKGEGRGRDATLLSSGQEFITNSFLYTNSALPSPPSSLQAKNGIHESITCDGCLKGPIVGFRYRCGSCKNHDLCGDCYKIYQSGTLPHVNPVNSLSSAVKDHTFHIYADKLFRPHKDGSTPLIKKPKPNEPCICGSEKKYKKCCGALATEAAPSSSSGAASPTKASS